MPPAQSGIAQYSADLLSAIDSRWPISVVADGDPPPRRGLLHRFLARARTEEAADAVLQVGNSGFHRRAFKRAVLGGNALVLHDVVLHHGRLAGFVRNREGSTYRSLMRHLYGVAGERVALDALRGHVPSDLADYPLCEDLVAAAKVTVVHSTYARDRVLRRVPGARVVVVPMGVPLPADVDKLTARKALRLPESAFVIASVTHVNPYKRLDVVVRAIARVRAVVPEALLVVAGTVSPAVRLDELIALHGVAANVRLLGYVSDDDARLVAQAADACVNLRFPSTGETSASLLRLLGAGKPVLVTDDASTADIPADVAIRVPVDAFEEEMIAEALIELAKSECFRNATGRNARAFIEREHSMTTALRGYRDVLNEAFELELPMLSAANEFENAPTIALPRDVEPTRLNAIETTLVEAADDLGVGAHDATILALASSMRALGLDGLDHTQEERGDERESTD